jgi:hypothetical protein
VSLFDSLVVGVAARLLFFLFLLEGSESSSGCFLFFLSSLLLKKELQNEISRTKLLTIVFFGPYL